MFALLNFNFKNEQKTNLLLDNSVPQFLNYVNYASVFLTDIHNVSLRYLNIEIL